MTTITPTQVSVTPTAVYTASSAVSPRVQNHGNHRVRFALGTVGSPPAVDTLAYFALDAGEREIVPDMTNGQVLFAWSEGTWTGAGARIVVLV